MKDKPQTAYEADELTQYIDQRRAALATPSPSRSVEPVAPEAEALAQVMFAEGIAPFRSRQKAERHGFEPRYQRNAAAILAALSDSGHILVERAELDRLRAVEAAAREVMAALTKYGPSIVPHLMDTDENAGERLRAALTQP